MSRVAVTLGTVMLCISLSWAADDQAEIAKRLAESKVLDEVMSTPNKGIPDGVIKRATCVGVFPATVQVAVLVGAKHGKGFVTCRTATGWTSPAPLTISGGSWGAQLGGQKVDLVMVITNEKGMPRMFLSKAFVSSRTVATCNERIIEPYAGCAAERGQTDEAQYGDEVVRRW